MFFDTVVCTVSVDYACHVKISGAVVLKRTSGYRSHYDGIKNKGLYLIFIIFQIPANLVNSSVNRLNKLLLSLVEAS